MHFRLEIKCDNAAFGDSEEPDAAIKRDEEIARILRDAAGKVEFQHHYGTDVSSGIGLYDSNGNHVGECGLHDK